MRTPDRLPVERPTGGLTGVAVGGLVFVLCVWLLAKLVLGVVFGIIGLIVPVALVAGGGALLATGRLRIGGAAVGVGLLMLVF